MSGWGGRIGDLFESGNGNSTFTCVNVSGNAVFMSGKSAVQYQVSTNGSVPLAGLKSPLFGSSAATEALRTLITQPRTHLLESEYNRVAKRSVDADSVLTTALASNPALSTVFPTPNSLGDQLKMVARMIAAAPKLGAKRQVFFVSLGGFDTHDSVATAHPTLMKTVADAMAAFYKSTVELGVANSVTAFTASDFGRTMVGNNDGSDHGWGSMHLVMGGAVKGKSLYGTAPVVANNGPDDVGQGRLLPTTSVDQLAATLGKWMGVSDSDLLTMLADPVELQRRRKELWVLFEDELHDASFAARRSGLFASRVGANAAAPRARGDATHGRFIDGGQPGLVGAHHRGAAQCAIENGRAAGKRRAHRRF